MPLSARRLASSLARIGMIAAMALMAGCAHVPPASDTEARGAFDETNDRLEPLNRTMFDIDQGLNAALIRPVTWTYRKVTPEFLRTGVTHMLDNVESPVTFVNDLLEGQPGRAAVTLWRLIVNSIFGLGGFFDVAKDMGAPGHTSDFGMTLARWGVGDGSYLYLPILGPGGIRDDFGRGVDAFAFDPFAWYAYNPHNNQGVQWIVLGAQVVDAYSNNQSALDELKKSSIDYYAALRSAYRQKRAKDIRFGAPPPAPKFDEDEGDPFAPEKPQPAK